ETPLLYKLKPEIENLLKTLSSSYLNMAYIKTCDDILKAEFKNTEHFVDLEKIYIGITATESIVNLKKDSNVPRSEITVNPSIPQQFEIQSIAQVFQSFPILNNFVTRQKVDEEWRAHAMLNRSQYGLNTNDNDSAENYWAKVFSLKNSAGQFLFSSLKHVLNLLLVLPFSNTSVERKFSVLRNLKTENRNRLHTDIVVALMATREDLSSKNSNIQSVPFKIHADCDAKVAKYFDNYVKTTEDKTFKGSFRGYPLRGKKVDMPEGYLGLVLHESIKPARDKDERKFYVINNFTNITFWNWDKIPSENDSIIQALQWIYVAEALHSPILEE
ncbi:hypothetical protein NQ314_018045, partial [Rhamnusium bicolor]